MTPYELTEANNCLNKVADGLNGLRNLGLTVKAKHNTVYTECGLVLELDKRGWTPRLFVSQEDLYSFTGGSDESLEDF